MTATAATVFERDGNAGRFCWNKIKEIMEQGGLSVCQCFGCGMI